jgi:hypothetical protein
MGAWQNKIARRPLAPSPTTAPPGSEEKIRILQWRISHKFSPFHPLDATGDPETERSRPAACHVLEQLTRSG